MAEVAGQDALQNGPEAAFKEIMATQEKTEQLMQKLNQAGIDLKELIEER